MVRNQAGNAPPRTSPSTNVTRPNEIFILKRWGRSSGVLLMVRNGALTTSRNAIPTPATKALISRGRGWRKRIWPAPARPMSALDPMSTAFPLKRSTHTPAGVCVDRFSGKAVLIGSSALIGLAGAGQILFRQPLPLLISAFVAGVGIAFLLVVNAPFLTINSTPEERPHLFSMNISLGLVTLVLGEVLGVALPAC